MLPTSLHTKRARHLAIAAVAFLAAITSASIAMSAGTKERGRCAFSRQLEDSYDRLQFIALLGTIRQQESDVEKMYGNITLASYSRERVELDPLSYDCLTCHDGISAPIHNIRYKTVHSERSISMVNVKGSHPIGMHYDSFSRINKELRPLSTLNKSMVFVNGNVGCLSCHNPLNPEKDHLVMNNERSELCFNCHNK